MKNKKQDTIYGIILISLGGLIVIVLGGPMAFTLLMLALGFYMINYGLQLCGGPSLLLVIDRIINDIRFRFFNK